MFRLRLIAALLAATTPVLPSALAQETDATDLRPAELGSTNNVHAFGSTHLAGQPSPEDLAAAKQRGIKTVITLREADEIDWDEAAVAKELDLDFHRYAIANPPALTDDIFESTLKLLADEDNAPVLLHCASANRVGAVWLAHRVVNDGLSVDAARKEAKTVGLRTPGYEERALAYIQQRRNDEASVKPGINDAFRNPQLDISEWLGRFEIESREVYAARERVLDIIDLQPGTAVADIGAGTGFYSRLFASAVGADGWVYAVDIAPRFLEHINQQAQDDGVGNLTCVLGTDRSIRLPPNSVDVVFICDTYHHFEYPQATLASIRRALKPGGTLIVIDFERIPGKSREFILGHVRAGKDVFLEEITRGGFQFVDEVDVPTLEENYFLRFRNAEAPSERE